MGKDYYEYQKIFIDQVLLTKQTDYASRASVKQHNLATDQYRNAARMIGIRRKCDCKKT